jgi:predicted nucleic acid-binding Zn ribbon protein
MPTYVYKFIDTGETIEVQQSFNESTLTEAPHPSDGRPRPVRKVFTPVGVTFKGNGFYKTDSRSSKNGSGSASKDGSSPSKESKDSKESKESSSSSTDGASSSTSSSSSSKEGGSASKDTSSSTSRSPSTSGAPSAHSH